ncbi:unnamed protein product [Ectocarpus sp. 6 AP-2014]
MSCSFCDCPEGWEGVDCGRCSSVSVCPDKTINGTLVSATNCSSSSLLPTAEESQQENGKVLSCSLGGGGDKFSGDLDDLQPDTWVEFTIKGSGTAESLAVMTFTEFAGTETIIREAWPGEHDFYYPVIYEGVATDCTVSEGPCLPVADTDIGEQQCVWYDCEDTQGSCPPEGYPVCDGFPECVNDSGDEYQVHTCTGAPASDKALTIACQDQQVDGTYICWYQQPGEFAPLSLTCSVGSCLYEGGEEVPVGDTVVEEAPLGTSEQSIILIAGALLLLLLFCLFALATDWGSARKDSKSFCFSKSRNVGGWEGGPAMGGAAASSSAAFGGEEKAAAGDDDGVAVAAAGAAVAGVGVPPAAPTPAPSPAVLEWKNLSYSVAVKTRGSDSGGGGVFAALASGCRYPELPVLSRVSGFAGPTAAAGTYPGGDGAASSVVSGGRPLSMSSNLSGAFLDGRAGFPARSASATSTDVAVADTGAAAAAAAAAAFSGNQPAGCWATTTTTTSTLTGILGPSGAGKSSLLDILAGRKRSGEGRASGHVSVSLDGRGRRGGPADIRRVAGYVPQEDVLPGTLTCYEHLMFHARLRMPRKASHAERRERALAVLAELGLSRVADSRVGDARKRGLSGGEKRRLSIAAELMAGPPLLFLDEPTTGLDAATALRVMVLLRGVASRGTTVLCSLHQPRPRVLNLLDNVMLLSRGKVAYFGSPQGSESYFSSVGRPFPAEQPHPADAMLTLCCREDGGALPALFERCAFVENGVYCVPSAATAAFLRAGEGGCVGGAEEPGSGMSSSRQSLRRDGSQHRDLEAQSVAGAAGGRQDDEEEEEEAPWLDCCAEGKDRRRRTPTAGFLVQTEALCRRLLLRAARHPLLLLLHFGGAVAMAACLGTIFQGRLGFTLDGAQSRFGVLFFLLLYLSLLSLTSLPVWREDRRLFLSESMGGAYGHLPYFLSVALADVLLVRVVPPLAFAVLAYPLMGLNDYGDGKWTLVWFSVILVLANVAVALAAMGIGALGLALDLSNILGGSMVLIFALFSRFLLNGSRIPDRWQWLSKVTPLGHAYESLLVNEFNDPFGARTYTIVAERCSPEMPNITAQGSTILETFNFDPSLSNMREGVATLSVIALAFGVLSFLLFYIFTRRATTPLRLRKSDGGRRRSSSRPLSATFGGNPSLGDATTTSNSSSNLLHAPVTAMAAAAGAKSTGPNGNGVAAGSAAVSSQDAAENHGIPPSGGGDGGSGAASLSAGGGGRNNGGDIVQPILLSWEDIGVPLPGGGKDGAPAAAAILNGVSGFAGPGTAAGNRNASPSAAAPAWSGSVTAIMGPSGAGKTTLLNVLAGRMHRLGKKNNGGRVTGAVRINGRAVTAAELRGVSGYVTQEDVLPETLTCFEHLMFHAELRMSTPQGVTGACGCGGGGGRRRHRASREDRKNRVLQQVLRELRLEDVRDSRIGGGLSRGISGGEKRRLSIATELLTCPGLLFLDEPTTGLDASTALTTMKLLSDLASSRGMTVLCSLHQPRPQVYDSLDRVLLVSRGSVSFFGPPASTQAYFASLGRPLWGGGGEVGARDGAVGLADAMLDVVGDAEIAEDGGKGGGGGLLVVMPREELVAKVRCAESAAPPSLGQKLLAWAPPVTTQLRALMGRAVRDVARDPYLATLHLVLTPLVGLLVGSLFGDLRRDNDQTAGIQGRLGVVFFFLLLLSFLCLTSLASWVRQMSLFRHERESGAYGAAAHLATSFLADALVCRVLPPVLLAATVRPLAGLRYGSLPNLCGGLVVFNVAVAAVLAACGAGARSPQEALAMGCLFVLFSALLSGFLVARDDLPGVWGGLLWASPIAHGEYGALFTLTTVISGETASVGPLTGDNILSCFGYENGRFFLDMGLLVAIGGAGLLLAYALLKRA